MKTLQGGRSKHTERARNAAIPRAYHELSRGLSSLGQDHGQSSAAIRDGPWGTGFIMNPDLQTVGTSI